jgi:1-acyl-sn-glycerol-3-phosphate acyltransferase
MILAEPWYYVAKGVAIQPARAWFRLRYEGLEHIPSDGPAIVACNHISYLDPLTNAAAICKAGRRPRFMAKSDLFRIPVVGTVLRGVRQIPVDRGGDPSTSLRAAERAIGEGEVVVIYPEGTVTKRPDHLPMRGRSGAVRLSVATGVPITPLASWGSQAVWQKSGRGSLRPGRPVWMRVGPAIDLAERRPDAGNVEALRAMTDEVMSVLTTMVEELRAAYPRRWSDDG